MLGRGGFTNEGDDTAPESWKPNLGTISETEFVVSIPLFTMDANKLEVLSAAGQFALSKEEFPEVEGFPETVIRGDCNLWDWPEGSDRIGSGGRCCGKGVCCLG
jgi:hypothetical protein